MADMAPCPGGARVEAAMPAKPQNMLERRAAELANTLRARVGTAQGETTTGVRLGCVPGKEHVIAQELCYKKSFLFVLRKGQHMGW